MHIIRQKHLTESASVQRDTWPDLLDAKTYVYIVRYYNMIMIPE